MAYNYDKVFVQIDERLSQRPATHLYEIVQQLGCSPSIIEKVIHEHSHLSFRDYQRKRQLERAYLLSRQGYMVKAIALELGYRWPANFSRFMRRCTGQKAGIALSSPSL